MNLKDLQNKKICILGWGLENQALVRFLLKKKIDCEITICDRKKVRTQNFAFPPRKIKFPPRKIKFPPRKIAWRLGKNYDKNLSNFDIIFRSPGYPLCKLSHPNLLLIRRGNKRERYPLISSPMKLFFPLCPTKNIIGVTGTKGKGTTVSLIYQILKAGKKRVWLGGNIGIAPFEFIDEIKKNDWVVLELSSFQLEDMEVSPRIAVITNFTREHLAPADPNNPNFHKTMADYWKAKSNIFRWQKKNDKVILSKKLEVRIKKYKFKNKIYTFSAFDKNADSYFINNHRIQLLTSNFSLLTSLLGEHNKENVAAAVAVAKAVGVKNEIIKKAVARFKGLEHRLELVKTVKGIRYYNDSFATTPESAIIALKSFAEPIILLAGGADKKSDFRKLAKEIKKRTKFVVLLKGKATPRIKKELLKAGYPKSKMKLVYNIKEAIKTARKNFVPGNIVLLSPACASFGMFKNYKERGEKFKQEVKKIK